jgi:hypothetical protein
MRILPLFAVLLGGACLAGCQTAPENVAIQNQYVGSDMTVNGRNPTASAVGVVTGALAGRPQARCVVVRYDPYGRPYCDTVKYIR